MRVKSAFTCVVVIILFIASSFTKNPQRDMRAKKVNLIIRQIGDELMKQAGDSTSQLLPVAEIHEGTFQLKFEKNFAFNHDSVMALAKNHFSKKHFPKGYTITVHDCQKGEIVYGFQVSHTSDDILACKGRVQAAGCYTFEFAFPDLYEDIIQDKAKPARKAKTKLAELKSLPVETNNHDGAETVEVYAPDESESNNKTVYLVLGGVVVISGVMLFMKRPKKKLVAGLPSIGKYLFDVKEQRLLFEGDTIALTDKECKVLEILQKNFGELIPRDTLMQEVWINEGVITGRSLDMFVSKLRKKLSADRTLRITNVHGKGYKLEVAES